MIDKILEIDLDTECSDIDLENRPGPEINLNRVSKLDFGENDESVKKLIDKIYPEKPREYTIDYILKIVCRYFKIYVIDIHENTRRLKIVQARQIAMYFSKSLTKCSIATIGAQIGGKDHATVLHACKTVNNLIDTDINFKNKIKELENNLTGKCPFTRIAFKKYIKKVKTRKQNQIKQPKLIQIIHSKGIYSNHREINEPTFQKNSFTIN